jgi:DNA repair photolyase
MGKITKGTKEWATTNVNIYAGCSHDCKYCYAKKMAIRFNRKTGENWKIMELNQAAYKKGYKNRDGRIMFPTTHDITEKTKKKCFHVLSRMLAAGNDVLITTKPDYGVIMHLCAHLEPYKDQVQFRFTITSKNNSKLWEWEPGAPAFESRVLALQHAFEAGYKTSISIEPCLDRDPRELIEILRPHVTESIWLGPMNYAGKHPFNTDEVLMNWVKWFEHDPLVRLKDSVWNRILGMEREACARSRIRDRARKNGEPRDRAQKRLF